MSAIKEALTSMTDLLILAEKVDQVGKTLSEVVKELRDQDKRIIRLETIVEVGLKRK